MAASTNEIESEKNKFVSTLKDFITDMAKTYPKNPHLERNRNRLIIASQNARDNVVNITGNYLIYHMEAITDYMADDDLIKFYNTKLFIYDKANADVIGDKVISKYVMELFEAMKDDLLKKDFCVMDDSKETTMSIRKKAADYIKNLLHQFIHISQLTGDIEITEDE